MLCENCGYNLNKSKDFWIESRMHNTNLPIENEIHYFCEEICMVFFHIDRLNKYLLNKRRNETTNTNNKNI